LISNALGTLRQMQKTEELAFGGTPLTSWTVTGSLYDTAELCSMVFSLIGAPRWGLWQSPGRGAGQLQLRWLQASITILQQMEAECDP
jgi:hypothetical protein